MKDPNQELAKVLKRHIKLKESEIFNLIETPPDSKLGDLCFPCFILAKKLKKAPNAVASDLSKKIKPSGIFSGIKSVGPYLNFYFNTSKISESVLKKIHKEKNKYGKSASKKKTAVVEYFQANTHKPVHIGHFRNICLGESLARVFEFNGFKVYRVSYGGDIGTHVAKCLWAYQKYHSNHRTEKEKNKGAWLGKVYAEGAEKFNESDKARNEIKELTNKLYLGKDKKLMALWKKTRQWSIDDFRPILKEIDVKFNALLWESQVSKPALAIAKDLLKKNIAEKSEGAVGINLEKYGLGYFVLLTSEGYPLYSSKDLALAKLKYQKFKGIENSIHVVGSEQNLHFKQLFKTFEIAGFKKLLRKNHHLSYQLVTLKSGKMSSRTGDIISYTDLVKKAKQKATSEIKKRNPKLAKSKLQSISNKVALGALKFAMLKQAPNKVIKFDWDEALAFEGDTGVYLQYTLVRANRILEKAKIKPKTNVDFKIFETPHEIALIKELAKFPEIIQDAAKRYEPYIIPNYALNIASKFSSFYEAIPYIIKSSKKEKEARLLLVACFAQVLKNCLDLMNIESVSLM